jgi:hypothetical protein
MSLRLLVLSAVMLASGSGCVRRYEEPALTEPHATVKIRVLHHERSGPQLDLEGRIRPAGDEYGIQLADDGLRVVRVRLVPTTYRVSSSFFHTTMQMQTVFVSESYACGTTSSGYGTHTYSQTQYCTRQVPRQQWVTVRVGDGDCQALAFQPTPVEGAVYLVQYDYFGPGVCSLTCLRQVDTGAGTFQFTPCGVGEPPALASVGGESPLVLQVVPPDAHVAPTAPAVEQPFTPPPPTTDAPFVAPSGAAALGAPSQP